MNDRVDLFAALAELARRHPHWRFGQLVANVAGWTDVDVWDAEDEQLLTAAREHLEASAVVTNGATRESRSGVGT